MPAYGRWRHSSCSKSQFPVGWKDNNRFPAIQFALGGEADKRFKQANCPVTQTINNTRFG
ncbi:hypothetical protein RvVAR0630_41680 [Agrobacterium vitis]|nr:hypothetical protein RvVAR0630_41680 [Agrobacterium vitis]